jgi:glutamate synthase domain-containing protein 1
MCGIVGFLDKRGRPDRPIGRTLLSMLESLACRGPDSTGVALFAPGPVWTVQIKLPDHQPSKSAAQSLVDGLRQEAAILRHDHHGAYLRLEIQPTADPQHLEAAIIGQLPGVEVVSLGHFEIVKQVGSPAQLEKTFGISRRTGTHGIGHTRLSTESRVDLSHSQPFWAHGVPDLATVHNGHITNYHKLRRGYEQRGYRFYTENDSEVIGIYLRDRLAAGLTLADALRSSLDDFDGSFSYLAASGACLAYVKDRFGFKPLMVAETDEFVAIATEEIALRQTLGSDFATREPAPGMMQIWTLQQEIDVATAKRAS